MIAIQRPAWDLPLALGMLILVLVASTLWYRALRPQHPRLALALLAGVAAATLVGAAGDAAGLWPRQDLQPPAFVLFAGTCMLLAATLGQRISGQSLLQVPLITWVALQIFRLPLELLMLRAAHIGVMPVEFSAAGFNPDILTGASALALVIWHRFKGPVPPGVIWAWNVFGIGCLAVIAALAALTSPNLRAFGTSAAHVNAWVLYFPYTLLPAVLVSLAVLGHVVLTRALLATRICTGPAGVGCALSRSGGLERPLWVKN